MTDRLFDWLAGLDAARLAVVLENRPDALDPPWPRRLDAVAARLRSPYSLQAATGELTVPHIQVLRAIQLCWAMGSDPVPVAEVARWLGTTEAVVESLVDALADRALAWRTDGGVVLPESSQSDGYSAYGLGRTMRDLLDGLTAYQLKQLAETLDLPSSGRKRDLLDRLVAFFQDGDRLRQLVSTASEPTQKLLTDIAHNRPDAEGLFVSSHTPQAWAFEHGLLFSTYHGDAYMPLEVSLGLRGPDYRLPFDADEPAHETTQAGVERVEATSAAAVLRLVDRVSTVLDLAAEPLPLLKNGTIGARLVKKIAKDTGGTTDEIDLALDLAVRAELLVVFEPEPAPKPKRGKAPTPEPAVLAVNDRLARPGPGLLYRLLLTTWWDGLPPDEFGIGEPDFLGDRVRDVLLRLLARFDPGVGVPDPDALTRLVAWHAPLFPHEDLPFEVRRAVEEGELLGVISAGALSETGRALLETDNAALVKVTEELVAHGRTTALFGTDLTAVVPGSPDARLAALLDQAADRENQGAATSWRFSPATVRRAFDQGSTADELLAGLRSAASGELPQPLVYLVNDVARRHGEARVIEVASVVVGDNPAVLAEIAGHRKLAKLTLRVVAPTVLTSAVDATTTLAALRDAGYAPTRHAADGTIVLPAREQPAPTIVVVDPDPDDAEPPRADPAEHAARLLATPATGPHLLRGQLATAMSNRRAGRLSADEQRACWQLEARMPVQLTYDGDELLVAFPELDGDVLDVWSVHESTYRRLDLDRVRLG